ncbi:MAG: Dickkopf N-terminal cysteine-rich domain-containing protein [Myxococcota bacterium]
MKDHTYSYSSNLKLQENAKKSVRKIIWTVIFLILIWTVVILVACQGREGLLNTEREVADVYLADQWNPDATNDVEVDPERLISEWCEPMAKLTCEAAIQCGCKNVPGYPSDLDNCISKATTFCADRVKNTFELVQAGQLVIYINEVSKCLKVMERALSVCAIPNPFVFSVDCVLFASPAHIGEPCMDALCDGGAGWCAPPGVCKPLPKIGEPCEASICAAGLRCDDGICRVPGTDGTLCDRDSQCVDPLLCISGRCVNPPSEEPSIKCTDPSTCPKGTYCLATTQRTCRPKSNVGEQCAADDCVDEAYCHEHLCVLRPEAGSPCGDGYECAINLACDPSNGICAPQPGPGEPCAIGKYGPVVCSSGLYCRDGVCQPPPGEGEPCAIGEDGMPVCMDGLGCAFLDSGSSICTAQVEKGSFCTNDSNCKEGLFCDFSTSTCTPFYETGQRCYYDNECGPLSACVQSSAGLDHICRDIPQKDELCNGRCAEGLVCRPVATYGICAPSVCTAIPF